MFVSAHRLRVCAPSSCLRTVFVSAHRLRNALFLLFALVSTLVGSAQAQPSRFPGGGTPTPYTEQQGNWKLTYVPSGSLTYSPNVGNGSTNSWNYGWIQNTYQPVSYAQGGSIKATGSVKVTLQWTGDPNKAPEWVYVEEDASARASSTSLADALCRASASNGRDPATGKESGFALAEQESKGTKLTKHKVEGGSVVVTSPGLSAEGSHNKHSSNSSLSGIMVMISYKLKVVDYGVSIVTGTSHREIRPDSKGVLRPVKVPDVSDHRDHVIANVGVAQWWDWIPNFFKVQGVYYNATARPSLRAWGDLATGQWEGVSSPGFTFSLNPEPIPYAKKDFGNPKPSDQGVCYLIINGGGNLAHLSHRAKCTTIFHDHFEDFTGKVQKYPRLPAATYPQDWEMPALARIEWFNEKFEHKNVVNKTWAITVSLSGTGDVNYFKTKFLKEFTPQAGITWGQNEQVEILESFLPPKKEENVVYEVVRSPIKWIYDGTVSIWGSTGYENDSLYNATVTNGLYDLSVIIRPYPKPTTR